MKHPIQIIRRPEKLKIYSVNSGKIYTVEEGKFKTLYDKNYLTEEEAKKVKKEILETPKKVSSIDKVLFDIEQRFHYGWQPKKNTVARLKRAIATGKLSSLHKRFLSMHWKDKFNRYEGKTAVYDFISMEDFVKQYDLNPKMPCISGKNFIICYNNIYKFKGFLFEWHDYFGCTELTKKGNPRKRSSKE